MTQNENQNHSNAVKMPFFLTKQTSLLVSVDLLDNRHQRTLKKKYSKNMLSLSKVLKLFVRSILVFHMQPPMNDMPIDLVTMYDAVRREKKCTIT